MRWTPDVPADGYETFAVTGSPGQRMMLASFGGRMALTLSFAAFAITAVTPGSPGSKALGVAVGCAGIVTGTILIRFSRYFRLGFLDALVPASVALFSYVGVVGGALEPLVPYVFLVYAAQIYAVRTGWIVVLHTIVIGAGYAATLVWGPDAGAPLTKWIAVMTAIVSSAYFTRWLMQQVQTLAVAEHQDRRKAEVGTAALVELSRAKSEFLARVSHELRTPLNAVVGFSQLLQSGAAGPLNDQQHDYIDDVVASSRHLRSLVDDVLDPASVESGAPAIDATVMDVTEVISEAVAMMRAQATAKGTPIHVRASATVGDVEGDRRKIRQAALNLLSNAVKFTPGGGQVEVEVSGHDDHVVVSVSDTGVGVSHEDRGRIFEAYQQGGRPSEGSGLGLAVTRRLVELHGGTLWVESTPGVGSAFSFRLPRRLSEVPGAGPRRATEVGGDLAGDDVVMAFTEPGSDANRMMLGRIGAGFGMLATAVGLVVALITPGEATVRLGVAVVALLGVVTAGMFRRRGRLPTPLLLDVVAVLAIATISVAVVVAGQFSDVVSLAYVWVVLVASALHSRGRTIARLVLVAVGYAVALAFSSGTALDAGRWISLMTVLVVNVTMVDWTVHRIREVAAAELASRRAAERVLSELAATSRHQSEFLASMSHELRTPLNSVIGFSELLAGGLTGPLTDQQADYVDEIVGAGRRLLALINDLLDLARLDAGRLELDLAEVPLDALVTGAAAVVRPTAVEHGVEIVTDVPADVEMIVGDPHRLEQALCHLLVNAVECTPRDGRVTVSARRMASATTIAVADTGAGIAPDQLGEIFEPFHRVPQLAPGFRSGPGLGLALVKGLMELHGGTVGVESVPGHGAVFTISVPTPDGPQPVPVTASDELTHG